MQLQYHYLCVHTETGSGGRREGSPWLGRNPRVSSETSPAVLPVYESLGPYYIGAPYSSAHCFQAARACLSTNNWPICQSRFGCEGSSGHEIIVFTIVVVYDDDDSQLITCIISYSSDFYYYNYILLYE